MKLLLLGWVSTLYVSLNVLFPCLYECFL
uniref:Uncharacterized protein n=1 Tax=Rhizophora mucronata TaxID=61149 RepID=A0A2P2R3Q4_RHIMU